MQSVKQDAKTTNDGHSLDMNVASSVSESAQNVSAVMTSDVITVSPGTSVVRARELLSKHSIHALPVMEHGKLMGWLTDRDLRDAYPAAHQLPDNEEALFEALKEVSVDGYMTHDVTGIHPEAPLRIAARIMAEQNFGALPVVKEGVLLGVLSRTDVLFAFAEA